MQVVSFPLSQGSLSADGNHKRIRGSVDVQGFRAGRRKLDITHSEGEEIMAMRERLTQVLIPIPRRCVIPSS